MLLRQTTSHYKAIKDTCTRIEGVYGPDGLQSADIDLAYEALFLKCVVVFENYLEQLFQSVMQGKIEYPAKMSTLRVGVLAGKTYKDLMYRKDKDKYLDWMPYSRTLERAELWLVGGRPFALIDDGDRDFLKSCYIIRNAIAHASVHSKQEFIKKVIGGNKSLGTNKTPARWLRAKIRIEGPETRLDAYIKRFVDCATIIYPPKLVKKETRD